MNKFENANVLVILIVGFMSVAMGLNSVAQQDRHFIPPKQFQYYPDTESQRISWDRAERACLPVDLLEELSTECMSALSSYFMKEPVWNFSKLYNFSSGRGLDSGLSRINSRVRGLPYGFDDYEIDDIPLWEDIFDGRLQNRKFDVEQTIADPDCNELSYYRTSGLENDMNLQCAAREMYKYATLLDACFTASDRLRVLDGNSPSTSNGKLNGYQYSLALIEENVSELSEREMATRRLQKGYLHAKWVSNQCGGELREIAAWTGSDESELYQSVKGSHDYALTVAARGGDEWAIRSYPLSSLDSDKFKQDLLEHFPLLMHRHLGAPALLENSVDRRRHQAKAYLLLEQLAGEEVAKREYDPDELKQELAYVREGGELAVPRSTDEVFQETLKLYEAQSEASEPQ